MSDENAGAQPAATPKIKEILDLIRDGGELSAFEKKQAEGMSATGALYKRMEKDLRGNRAAIGFMRRMIKMSPDKRNDVIRTLEPLMVEAGYTLDVIDPEDLVAKASKPTEDGGDDGEDADDDNDEDARGATEPAGDNSNVSALDAARMNLAGEASPEAADRAAAANGSAQLRKFKGAIEAGRTVKEAAKIAEMSAEEAELTSQAMSKGELDTVVGIAPPPKRAKPRLSIATGGSEATA